MDRVIEVEKVESENPILMFYDNVLLIATYNGTKLTSGNWLFTIPANDTADKQGLYWYCIYEKENKLCLKKPIYF